VKDQPKKLVLPITGPSPRRSSRTAWARAVAAVAAGGLLLTVSASVPVPHVPDGDRDLPVRLQEPVESTLVGRTTALPEDVRPNRIVTVVERGAELPREQDADYRRAVAQAVAQFGMLFTTRENQGSPLRENLLGVVTMFGGSTLGYANGRIPVALLCPLRFAPVHLLRCDAAERLTALSDEFEREFGYPLPITDSYRSYVQQIAVASAKPHLAAVPGTSNHGWGLAVDLGGRIAGGTSQEYAWLRVHGPAHGWDNPSWARLGGSKPEPWHFEFFVAGTALGRASDPSDVGAWVTADPSGPVVLADGPSPRDKRAPDPGPKHVTGAGGVRKAPTRPTAEAGDNQPSQRLSKPTPKPTPSPAPSSAPSPTPSPSEPGQRPSTSPSPAPSEPTPGPTPTPTSGGESPHAPTPSPSPSASSGPLAGLARSLGLAVGDSKG
jgi:hypothetical protein